MGTVVEQFFCTGEAHAPPVRVLNSPVKMPCPGASFKTPYGAPQPLTPSAAYAAQQFRHFVVPMMLADRRIHSTILRFPVGWVQTN